MNKLKLAIALAVLALTSICQVWASDDDIIQRGNIQTLSTSSVRVQLRPKQPDQHAAGKQEENRIIENQAKRIKIDIFSRKTGKD